MLERIYNLPTTNMLPCGHTGRAGAVVHATRPLGRAGRSSSDGSGDEEEAVRNNGVGMRDAVAAAATAAEGGLCERPTNGGVTSVKRTPPRGLVREPFRVCFSFSARRVELLSSWVEKNQKEKEFKMYDSGSVWDFFRSV